MHVSRSVANPMRSRSSRANDSRSSRCKLSSESTVWWIVAWRTQSCRKRTEELLSAFGRGKRSATQQINAVDILIAANPSSDKTRQWIVSNLIIPFVLHRQNTGRCLLLKIKVNYKQLLTTLTSQIKERTVDSTATLSSSNPKNFHLRWVATPLAYKWTRPGADKELFVVARKLGDIAAAFVLQGAVWCTVRINSQQKFLQRTISRASMGEGDRERINCQWNRT